MNIDFLEFIESTNRTSTNKELFALFRAILSDLGFDQITYNLLTDHASHGLRSKFGILKECPADWYKHYFEKGYQYIDPRISFGQAYRRAFSWRDMERHIDLSKKEISLRNDLADMNLHDGVAIPVITGPNEISGITVSRVSKDVCTDMNGKSLLQAICNQFHTCYLSINSNKQPDIPNTHRLTNKEREVLHWCAYGKSNWDISVIMAISEHGVEYHLTNIYRKLGVDNRVGAVIHAVKAGYITI